MMMNLFSVFDPSTSTNLSLNWLSMITCFLVMPMMYWINLTPMNIMIKTLLNAITKEFAMLLNFKTKNFLWLGVSLLIIIMINNSLGLIPYIFTSTSHMSITLSYALPLWMSFMLLGWITNFNHMMAHLIPQSTPMFLSVFMVLIEMTSNIIRPMTLAIRLATNMVAGHLLLTLSGNMGQVLSYIKMSGVILVQTLLMGLEIGVAFIQAYVYATLLTLYVKEVL
uniref:ATP synthase subunit a n=1 Tax=Neomysis orientalis TaxID=1049546 RepID=T2B2B3_9CRUS|nr:ATP synthase F0 subunit 6 [Neomysis orientalis]